MFCLMLSAKEFCNRGPKYETEPLLQLFSSFYCLSDPQVRYKNDEKQAANPRIIDTGHISNLNVLNLVLNLV